MRVISPVALILAMLLAVLLGLGQPARANSITVAFYGVGFDTVNSPLFGISASGPGVELGMTGIELLNSLAVNPDGLALVSVGRLANDERPANEQQHRDGQQQHVYVPAVVVFENIRGRRLGRQAPRIILGEQPDRRERDQSRQHRHT